MINRKQAFKRAVSVAFKELNGGFLSVDLVQVWRTEKNLFPPYGEAITYRIVGKDLITKEEKDIFYTREHVKEE